MARQIAVENGIGARAMRRLAAGAQARGPEPRLQPG
jgi:hypothetical protein